jgi:hypothetical protein
MPKTVEQQIADAHAERDEASRIADEALGLLAAATAAVVNGAAPAKPEAPPPPTPAPAPFVPAPASFNEWVALPAAQKAAVVAAHGADTETRLYEAKMLDIRMSNARRGFAAVIQPPGGGGHIEPAYRAEDYLTPLQISRAHNAKTAAAIAAGRAGASELDQARVASMNRGVGAGWGAGAVTLSGAPKSAPVPAQKVRHVGIRK